MEKTSYILQSKDLPLVAFDLYVHQEKIHGEIDRQYHLKITKIFEENKSLFPKNLLKIDEDNLLIWMQSRRAPKNRQFVNKIMSTYDDNKSPISYVDISYALSVNDAFWIINKEYPRKWKECNLYDHKFDKILAYVAFTGHSKKISGIITSPEFTTDGAQKKSWSNRKDGIYLIKGQSEIFSRGGRSDVFCEYYAAQIANVMKIQHIKYDIEEFKHHDGKKELVSVCKLFTSNETGYVPIYYVLLNHKEINLHNLSSIKTEMQIADVYGKKAFEDMMVFDSIIYNVDRHLKNFGLLVDNDSGKIKGPAPLFDHGISLLIGAAETELNDPHAYGKTIESKFDIDFDLQAKRFIQPRHLEPLRKLTNFKFKRHEKFNMPEENLTMLEKFIQHRGKELLHLYREKIVSYRAENYTPDWLK